MTRGQVNPFRYAEVEIVVRGSNGQPDKKIAAIIDTGFDGGISLPQNVIDELALPYFEKTSSVVFGGAEVTFDVYWAVVELDGAEIQASAISADNPPLVGMGLLYGCHLSIDVIDGGMVTIQSHPEISTE